MTSGRFAASEVAVKEVEEETGILAEPVRIIAVLDGLRLGFTTVHFAEGNTDLRAELARLGVPQGGR